MVPPESNWNEKRKFLVICRNPYSSTTAIDWEDLDGRKTGGLVENRGRVPLDERKKKINSRTERDFNHSKRVPIPKRNSSSLQS